VFISSKCGEKEKIDVEVLVSGFGLTSTVLSGIGSAAANWMKN